MIVSFVSDPYLRSAVRNAAHPEEDVIASRRLAMDALQSGFPRLVVVADGADDTLIGLHPEIPVLRLEREMLSRWERERRAIEIPPDRIEYLTTRIRSAIDKRADETSWVDRCLADLSRAAGQPLPPSLRAFGRRILEFPAHYNDLHAMADTCEMTRGALKARFRRRGLDSPYTYLRWFRILAVANLLSDRNVTVAAAAQRLGFTSDGNLCRAMLSLTALTPTEARTLKGWQRLIISFVWTHLTRSQLEGWKELDELFGGIAA